MEVCADDERVRLARSQAVRRRRRARALEDKLAHFRVSIATCRNLFEGVKRRRGGNPEKCLTPSCVFV